MNRLQASGSLFRWGERTSLIGGGEPAPHPLVAVHFELREYGSGSNDSLYILNNLLERTTNMLR